MMLHSMLVGVNGSDWSRNATEWGVHWASRMGIPVTCLGVVDRDRLTAAEPVPLGASAFKVDRDAKVIRAETDRINTALQAVQELSTRNKVACRCDMREGDPARELGAEAQRHDLVVLGRRANPESDRDPPASTTLTEILRHACRPVVVVGAQRTLESAVVVAYDGSAQAARALKSFVESGLMYDHPLHVVGIGDDAARVQREVGRAVDYLRVHGRTCEQHMLPVRGSVAETLAQFARQLPAGLVVMGVYGQPKLKELLFGSVTTALLRDSPAPLFLDH